MNKLEQWETTWGMQFHPNKCEHICITRKRKPLTTSYTLRGHTLKKAPHSKYLGVNLSSNLTWNNHINKTITKANQSLGLIKRNLKSAPEKLRETAYKSLVRPQLEYCGSIWDPYTSDNIHSLEMVQRRAARFVLKRYHNTSSVSDMISQLGWETLQIRRAKTRLILMYKATKCYCC